MVTNRRRESGAILLSPFALTANSLDDNDYTPKFKELAAESEAKLIIATGYFREPEDGHAADVLKEEAYMVAGRAPIYAVLREGRRSRCDGRSEQR